MKRIVWRGLPFRNKFYKNIGNEQSTPIKNIDLFSVNIFKVKSCEKVKSKMFYASPILEQKKVFLSSAFLRLLNVRQILDIIGSFVVFTMMIKILSRHWLTSSDFVNASIATWLDLCPLTIEWKIRLATRHQWRLLIIGIDYWFPFTGRSNLLYNFYNSRIKLSYDTPKF